MANVTGTNGNDDGVLNPILNGTALSDNIFGLAGNDILLGLGGDDNLNGGTGNDRMVGDIGNDTYTVDSALDTVVELAGQGTDTVFSSINYVLGANVENLTLTGVAIAGTGNALNNVITGNASANILFGNGGNDTLNGGLGADQMSGGSNNDAYIVDNAADLVVELAGQGIDNVLSSVNYALGANVENLTLTGTAIVGTGNALNNLITGNASANTLSGNDGNDTINAGDGNDFLTGGNGNDVLLGGNGNDLLIGGNSSDTLVGGAGLDFFRFNNPLEGIDNINFVVADDTIQVVQAAFGVIDPATGNLTNLPLGALAAGQFRVGAGAADRNDYFVYNSITGALSFDGNGSGAGGAVQIAQLGAGLPMSSFDVVVV
jgi:Ca2+-binding RTX toxin-like protein